MSKVATIHPLSQADAKPAISFMGPARVLSVTDGIVARRSDGREVSVTMALALAYEPVPHDLLLVVGGTSGHFAIGVIDGAGKTSLCTAGDLDLRACGSVNISADHGVRMHSPEVEIVSDSVKVVAGRAVQKLGALYQHVRELWSVKADSAHLSVSGQFLQRSRSATVLAEEVVTVNGKQIQLG